MSWVCPWCGNEHETELPEGRMTTECWHCHKTVPSKDNFRRFREKEIERLEAERFQLELQMDRIEYEIIDLKSASFDRPKVRHIPRDQTKLSFEVAA